MVTSSVRPCFVGRFLLIQGEKNVFASGFSPNIHSSLYCTAVYWRRPCQKNILGRLIGFLIALISITLMLRFLPWNAYGPVYFVVFAVTGWMLGRQREVDRGMRFGAIIGAVISTIITYVIYLPYDDFAPIFVWFGSIYLGILLGKKINIGNGSSAGMGMAIGIVLDVVIVLFFLFGFSVY